MTASGSPTPLPHNYAPRWYQQPLWDALTRRAADGNLDPVRRIDAVIHRRGGKDFTAWNAAILLANEWRVGQYFYSLPTYAQAKLTIWKGRTLDRTGLTPSVRFLDCIPPDLVARKRGGPAINDSEMSVEFTNGSMLQLIGGDNYNTIVGANPVFLCLSEWSLTDPEALDYFRPMITNNDGVIVYLYTPRGHNHGSRTHDRHMQLMRERPDRYLSIFLPNKVTGAIPQEAIEDDRAEGMSDTKIAQEYECDFDVANEGSYYGRLMTEAKQKGRIGLVPHDPSLKVHTAWDIGYSDHTVIWFVQVKGNALFVIDYYANHSEGLDHYVRILDDRAKSEGYRYDKHVAPHDSDHHSKTRGESYTDYARQLGIRFTVLKLTSVESGIEAVRSILPRCYFNEATTKRGVEALASYTKKWNDALKVWSDEPQHDWASHPADGFRYLAQAEKAKVFDPAAGTFTRPATREPSPWEIAGRR